MRTQPGLVRPEAPVATWQGTSRYRLVRELGKGGMGVVYEAFDSERARSVALKTVLDLEAAGLYRFKQEFRTLSDVVHPNLVRLHELVVSETDGVFFTMEFVAGVDFLTYVRPRAPDEAALDGTIGGPRATLPPGRGESQRPCATDLGRIRPALRQLVEGVQALHVAGHLHRDLKPSNVLVAADGRVVVLDLGVATSLRRVGGDDPEEPGMVGTSTYMAPEQALGETLTPAADWYSVGVILYEALTGHPPFVGTGADVITRKNLVDAVPPSQCVHGVPADLDALCIELLQREPDLRPTGLDLLRRLGTPSARPHSSLAPVADPTRASALFGREEQLDALRAAFERVRSGHTVAVRLGGESGMGKSAVATHFLDGLVEGREAIVLRGRAYEREALPYKAVDSVVDEVSRHLARSDEDGDPIELPPGIGALARVFPVLQRVPAVAESGVDVNAEPRELRIRAFEAVRGLLASLGARRPVVVYIDDAQWGDADSAALLLALVRPPEPPPLLLLMTYRSNEAARSVFLNELRDGWPDEIEQRDVPVGPLRPEHAQALARTFLDGPDDVAQRTARAVARESQGNPFLVQELARSNAGSDRRAAGETLSVLTLEEMVSRRLERLTEDARRTIEIIAVNGGPVLVSVVGAAAGLHEGIGETIAGLGARRFVRTGQRDGRDVVETTHDRIRETISALLPARTQREHHGALARALEETPGADAEAIALHWLGAGDPGRAVRFAEDAAQRSMQKLAFEHAARLVRLALEHTPPASAHAQELRVRLAAALMAGGRYAESSRAYIEAAAAAAPEQRVEYQRAAAEQLLASGQLDDGAALLYSVLAAVGVRAPRSQLGAVLWLIVYRIWLGVLGLRFRERGPSEVAHADRLRMDALSTAAAGLGIVNSVVGACMTARYLIEALRKGDRVHVMRAMAHEGSVLAAGGGRQTARERALVDTSVKLAEREGTAVAGAYVHGARGIGLFLRGRFEEARMAFDLGLTVPHYGHAGYSSVRLFAVYTAMFLGDFNEARARSTRLLVEAEERGDKYMLVNLNTSSGMTLAAAADALDRARRVGRDAVAQLPANAYLVQHWQAAAYGTDVDLYAGDAAAGYDRMKQTMPALEKSFLLHSAFMRIMTTWVQGRVAIASIASCPEARGARMDEARRAARKLERESSGWARSIAAQVRAVIANAEGDRATAIAELRLAVERLPEPHGMFAWWLDHRLGLLLGGEQGMALVRRAVASMRAQGIRDPDRWVGVFMPGDWSEGPATASGA